MTENFKTMKQAELEINPPKKLKGCNNKQCFCTGECKKEVTDDFLSQKLQLVLEQFSEAKDFKLPVSGLITPLKKSSLVSQVRELVKSNTNDMLLGEAVRKLFS